MTPPPFQDIFREHLPPLLIRHPTPPPPPLQLSTEEQKSMLRIFMTWKPFTYICKKASFIVYYF